MRPIPARKLQRGDVVHAHGHWYMISDRRDFCGVITATLLDAPPATWNADDVVMIADAVHEPPAELPPSITTGTGQPSDHGHPE